MPKIYMLLGILLGILCGILTGCQTSNQTVVVGGTPTQSLPRHVVDDGREQFALEDSYALRGYGPCGPRCAPPKAAMIAVKRPRPPLFKVVVVRGGGNCAPRQRFHHQSMVRQGCEPEWYQRDWIPVDNRNCPPPGWNGHQQSWPGSRNGGQQDGLTWGNPNYGPGGYR